MVSDGAILLEKFLWWIVLIYALKPRMSAYHGYSS